MGRDKETDKVVMIETEAHNKEEITGTVRNKVVVIIQTGLNKTGVAIQISKDLTTEINSKEIILTGNRKTVAISKDLITEDRRVEEIIQTGISKDRNRTGHRNNHGLTTDQITKTNRNKVDILKNAWNKYPAFFIFTIQN